MSGPARAGVLPLGVGLLTVAAVLLGAPYRAVGQSAPPDFLAEFAVHRLFGGFVLVDAALGKLPGILANALGPEEFALIVAENNSDIWPETIRINHSEENMNTKLLTFFQIYSTMAREITHKSLLIQKNSPFRPLPDAR